MAGGGVARVGSGNDAWDPHFSGVLATAGTQDKHIQFRNVINGSILHELDSGSQVTFFSPPFPILHY